MASPSTISPERRVRDYFGLTQAELAGYLDVSRAQLASAETGRRALPAAALLRLGGLAREAATAEPTAAVVVEPAATLPLAPEVSAELRPLLSRYTTCLLEAEQLMRTATPLAQRAAQVRRLLAVLPTMAAALPPLPADERAHRWLTHLATDRTRLASPGETVRLARLQARAAGLRAEAEWLAGFITNNFGKY